MAERKITVSVVEAGQRTEEQQAEHDAIIFQDIRDNAVLSAKDFRKRLTALGWRQLVEDHIDTADQDMKDEYNTSTYFERMHPLVVGVAGLLNKTEADIDTLFGI